MRENLVVLKHRETKRLLYHTDRKFKNPVQKTCTWFGNGDCAPLLFITGEGLYQEVKLRGIDLSEFEIVPVEIKPIAEKSRDDSCVLMLKGRWGSESLCLSCGNETQLAKVQRFCVCCGRRVRKIIWGNMTRKE